MSSHTRPTSIASSILRANHTGMPHHECWSLTERRRERRLTSDEAYTFDDHHSACYLVPQHTQLVLWIQAFKGM
ncbi:hypothetical protein P692DRAFT_201796868, partial [Suillus brevipes Sb2]